MGKRTAQKDAIKDTTSDSQVNNCFPYRWPPASLTINIYFYLFLYQYITRITTNNGTPHLKPPKKQNRRAALGRPAIKLLGGGGALTSLWSTNPRPNSALVHQKKQLQQKHLTTTQQQTTKSKKKLNIYFTYFLFFFNHKARQRAKWAAMQVATMLADNKQIDKRTTRNQNRSAALGRPAMKLLGGFN